MSVNNNNTSGDFTHTEDHVPSNYVIPRLKPFLIHGNGCEYEQYYYFYSNNTLGAKCTILWATERLISVFFTINIAKFNCIWCEVNLTTALLSGVWVLETSSSFHCWQPAPRWRLQNLTTQSRAPCPCEDKHPSHW